MPRRQLHSILGEFKGKARACRRLGADAYRWFLPSAASRITAMRRDWLTELAFLRMYLAWETFLEECFIAYLMGLKAPRGRIPYRFTTPPDEKRAREWVIPEGRLYAKWDESGVGNRALRFFRGGYPFTTVLRSSQSFLEETRKIRNAVAHESAEAREKFEAIARVKLGGTLPPKLTVGGFLGTTVPGSAPPQSFLEFYLERIEFLAERIVPS